MSEMTDTDCVRVAIRIRPIVPSEFQTGCQIAVERTPGEPQVFVNKSDMFTFNYVFDEDNTQAELYQESVHGLIEKLFEGYNVTILAYGQTGSGKTYTMGTAFDGNVSEDVGVIPRAMDDIFSRIQKSCNESDFTVKCSFTELYQEQLFDLLSNSSREKSIIEIREDRNNIQLPGLTEKVVHSAQQTVDCLVQGSKLRQVGSTAMNQQSSRSHAIFTVIVQAARKDEMGSLTTSKFNLVDLAGSERSKKTKAIGERFKEGVKINQGLLALGNVISALGTNQGSGYVGYRDSKLTRLLQDSLGGNSVTLMIACVSPADYNVAETLSTLRYADRARKIKNKPIVNQDPQAAQIMNLKSVIQKLRMELIASGGSMSSSLNGALQSIVPSAESAPVADIKAESIKKCRELEEKNRKLQKYLQTVLDDVAVNEMRAHITDAAHEKLKARTDEMRTLVEMLKEKAENEQPIEPKQILEMWKLVEGFDEELENTQTEITVNTRCVSKDGSNGAEDGNADQSIEITEFMQEQTETYTSKQMNFQEELRRLNRELNIKEELHQRCAGNYSKFFILDENVDEKIKECESKILELEAEKNDLTDKLKHVKENASAKIAEERRKRLQVLEQEINDMKRRNMQQSKLLKVREKETLKIANLHREIQAMKESKVKLVRSMRQESENFRQWKLMREKELMQLKNKDRKMQNEMKRQEMLHTKQKNVFKRKFEEATAINKRLKDALEKQKVAQSMRQKQQSAKDSNSATNKIDQIVSWLERELEVFISIADAENSLEQLMTDRGIISNRVAELQKQQPKNNTPAAAELANLEEELEMRNAQIADLNQKVCVSDFDTRVRSMCEHIQTLAEARAALNHLLHAIADTRRNLSNKLLEQKEALETLEERLESAEKRCDAAAKRMRLMEIEHEENIAERENTYEDKIAVLLRQLYNTQQVSDGDVHKIQEEQLNKMDELREELESYKKQIAELQHALEHKRKKPKLTIETNEKYVVVSSSEDDDSLDGSVENDPDWIRTPRFKKRTVGKRSSKRVTSEEEMQEDTLSTDVSSTNSINAGTKAKKGCSCRFDCKSKRCGCRSKFKECSFTCSCSKDCSNGKFKSIDEDKENEKSNQINPEYPSSSQTLNGLDGTFLKAQESTFLLPKIARHSQISFETVASKRKFFG